MCPASSHATSLGEDSQSMQVILWCTMSESQTGPADRYRRQGSYSLADEWTLTEWPRPRTCSDRTICT